MFSKDSRIGDKKHKVSDGEIDTVQDTYTNNAKEKKARSEGYGVSDYIIEECSELVSTLDNSFSQQISVAANGHADRT